MKQKIGFIGLGLIGGSIAKAVRQYYPDYEIVAFDKNKEALALATQESVIDVAATTIDNNFHNCNYIFLCAPVASNTAYLKQLTEYLDDDCILTIENAYFILTPTDQVAREKVEAYEKFAESLKALPVILDYRVHDQITGTISHLPHIIASTLVNFVKTHDTKDEMMKNLAAGGFKDITRIASSSPVMWQNICLKNKDNIVKILDQYINSLEDFKEAVEREDDLDLYTRFESSRNYRNSMPSSSAGPIKKSFAVYCDIIDEAGGIAAIATILASNNISIKNIGIVHNRESEEGVLRIEFYDEDSSKRAVGLLQKFRYIVYER